MVLHPQGYQKKKVVVCQFCLAEVNYSDRYCKSCKTYIALGNQTVKSKRKEEAVRILLEKEFSEMDIVHDRPISKGCSQRRPDFTLQAKWGTVVIEVDEFQHRRKNYPCACEVSRMREIYFDAGLEHMMFIRYNPDSYQTLNGEKCVSLAKRQEYLIKYLHEILARKPRHHLSVSYLFYDGFTYDSVEKEYIDPYA
jgi:hypothetical protein